VRVTALGVIARDGAGYELTRELAARGVDSDPLVERAARFTPTYTKPMLRARDGQEHEIERLDIKNRSPLPPDAQALVIDRLRELVPHVHGVVIADQVSEANCGTITGRVRDEIAALAERHPDLVFAADSRVRIGLFRRIIVKPNAREAIRAAQPDRNGQMTPDLARESGFALYQQNRKPVFLTVGAQGILLFTEAGCQHVPTIPVAGQIDIVGAGDSVMAGVVSALCCGATPAEAALVGNLVASITIQQIGATGTATPAQVRERFLSANPNRT
jgi:bifunctional ADP-heptose synthase (sugar kinase/adenylyltransferase)